MPEKYVLFMAILHILTIQISVTFIIKNGNNKDHTLSNI